MSLLIAEISGAQWIAIAAILGGLTFTILLIVFGLKFVQRRQELWHETARVALEKGQPLPPLRTAPCRVPQVRALPRLRPGDGPRGRDPGSDQGQLVREVRR